MLHEAAPDDLGQSRLVLNEQQSHRVPIVRPRGGHIAVVT
jgi:hypothetical protein